MLLSDPSAHGSLETPVDVQGKATRDLKQSTTATERWHYAIKLEQVLRPIGVLNRSRNLQNSKVKYKLNFF